MKRERQDTCMWHRRTGSLHVFVHVLQKAMTFEFTYCVVKLSCFLTLATVSVQKYHSAYQLAGHRRIISPLVEIVLLCGWTEGQKDGQMDRRGELKCSEYSQLILLETSKWPPAVVLSLPPVDQHLASLSLTESLAHLLLIQGIGNPYLT